MEEVKPVYALHHYSLKILTKHRCGLAPHYLRERSLKRQWHLTLVKVAPVDLCPWHGVRSLTRHGQQAACSDGLRVGLGGLSHPGSVRRGADRLLCAEPAQWLPQWM